MVRPGSDIRAFGHAFLRCAVLQPCYRAQVRKTSADTVRATILTFHFSPDRTIAACGALWRLSTNI
jgi:hypothetical protein